MKYKKSLLTLVSLIVILLALLVLKAHDNKPSPMLLSQAYNDAPKTILLAQQNAEEHGDLKPLSEHISATQAQSDVLRQ